MRHLGQYLLLQYLASPENKYLKQFDADMHMRKQREKEQKQDDKDVQISSWVTKRQKE